MKRRILIDGNSIGFAAHSGSRLSTGDQETQAVFGTIKTIRKMLTDRVDMSVIVLWDGNSWRKDALPTYKANRDATKKQRENRSGYKSQTKYTKAALKVLGITQVTAANYEADDLAGMLVQQFSQQGDQSRLITRDQDWLQLVRPGVVWEDHRNSELVGCDQFKSKTGYKTPEAFLDSKALQGDAGDNISGVGGVGPGRAKNLLDCWSSVNAFWAEDLDAAKDVWVECHGSKMPATVAALHQDPAIKARFKENRRLMDLINADQLPPPVDFKVTQIEPNPAMFRELCLHLGFQSILNSFDSFLHPFIESKNA